MSVFEGVGPLKVTKKMFQARLKKALSCLRLLLLTRKDNDLFESHTSIAIYGEFRATLDDMARLTMLPTFDSMECFWKGKTK